MKKRCKYNNIPGKVCMLQRDRDFTGEVFYWPCFVEYDGIRPEWCPLEDAE